MLRSEVKVKTKQKLVFSKWLSNPTPFPVWGGGEGFFVGKNGMLVVGRMAILNFRGVSLISFEEGCR